MTNSVLQYSQYYHYQNPKSPITSFSTISLSNYKVPSIHRILSDLSENMDFLYFSLALWSCYVYAEQQAIAVMMFVKNGMIAAIVNIYITCIYVMLASGVLR